MAPTRGTILLICLVLAYETIEVATDGIGTGNGMCADKPNDLWNDQYFSSFMSIFIPLSDRVTNPLCKEHSELYLRELRNHTVWAVQMFDASAKFPVGVLSGSTYQLGNFDQCLRIKVPLRGSTLSGQYCISRVRYRIRQKTGSPSAKGIVDLAAQIESQGHVWKLLTDTQNRLKIRKDVIHWALCIPASCGPKDLEVSLNDAFNSVSEVLNLEIKAHVESNLCQVEEERNLDDRSLNISYIILIYLLFILICSIFDSYMNQSENKEAGVMQRYIGAFSVQKNFQSTTSMEPVENSIKCMNGLRVYTMFLIIMAHRGEASSSGPFLNGNFIEDSFQELSGILVLNGSLVVDTFFTIGGYLVCHILLKDLDTKKSLHILSLYLYRYVRLTPAYLTIIAIKIAWLYNLDDGPLWQKIVGKERENCINNWWTNVLYVNNHVDPKNPCIDPAWYLACDTQMFLVAPFLVYSLWKWRKHAKHILGFAFLLSFLIPFGITYAGNLDATVVPEPSSLGNTAAKEQYTAVYITAYCRSGPYLVGIAFAFYLYQLQQSAAKFPQILVWGLWLVGLPLCLGIIFTGFLFFDPARPYNALEAGLYAGLHRTLFSVPIALLITSCAIGSNTLVNSILSWGPLQPLARLTYCAFLCHGLIHTHYVGTIRAPEYQSFGRMFWMTAADIFIAYILALVLSLTFESPFIKIGKLLQNGGRRKKKISTGDYSEVTNNNLVDHKYQNGDCSVLKRFLSAEQNKEHHTSNIFLRGSEVQNIMLREKEK